MTRSKTFPIFLGSSRTIRWFVYNDDKVTVEANSTAARIINKDTYDILNVLAPVRENVGIYSAAINTTALGLETGTYIIEFSCLVAGQNKAIRDYIKVKYMI